LHKSRWQRPHRGTAQRTGKSKKTIIQPRAPRKVFPITLPPGPLSRQVSAMIDTDERKPADAPRNPRGPCCRAAAGNHAGSASLLEFSLFHECRGNGEADPHEKAVRARSPRRASETDRAS